MKRIMTAAFATAILALATSATAQSGGNNYGGTPPWTFRSDSERIARTNQTNTIEAQRRGAFAGGAGGAGGSGWGASSTAVSNYFSVTNNTNCYSGNGAVGSPVTCTGGTNSVQGTNQSTSGSTIGADTTLTGNTINTSQSGNAVSGGTGSVTNNNGGN